MRKGVLYNDVSEHNRLRRPLNRAFNPAAFKQLRSEIESLAQGLLAKAERHPLDGCSERLFETAGQLHDV